MSKMMSKRFSRIIDEVVHRWRETITSTAAPDLDGAVKFMHKAHRRPQIFAVRSPIEFYVAQAVLRGRVSKKKAHEMAEKLGIDPWFIKQLTRLGSSTPLMQCGRWMRHEATTTFLTATTERYFQNYAANAAGKMLVPIPGNTAMVQLQNVEDLYLQLLPRPLHDAEPGVKLEANHRDWRLNFYNAQSHVAQAVWSRHEAVSEHVDDILAGAFIPNWHKHDAVQTEILCKAVGCKDPNVIWPYELFHYVPAFMQFDNAYLLLAGKPEIAKDENNQLHNEAGPSVVWPDGKKFWHIEGHALNQFGEKIVMQPETLTKDEILSINNEEERRIAIDRMGWHKYLAAIDAKIIDSQENWVDNTFEVLIAPPKSKKQFAREEPLRMVLSCRSTGRKYFIAVPPELPNANLRGAWATAEELKRYPAVPVKTCEQAQRWLADGATTEYLNFAKHPIRVVGAS